MRLRKKTEQALHWILLAAGLLIFGLLIHRAGWNTILHLCKTAAIRYWGFGLGAYGFSMLLRGVKWYLLIRLVDPVRFSQFLPVYFFNALMGNITPFKSGEAAGPVLFKRFFGVEIGRGFSVIFIDRILELLWMLICLILGFVYLTTHVAMTPALSSSILVAGGLTLILIGVLVVVLSVERLGYGMMSFLLRHFRQARIQQILQRIQEEFIHFYEFRKSAFRSGRLIVLNLLTGSAFFAQFLAVWFVVLSVVKVSFMASLTAQAIAIPISIVSFIPAGIGIAAFGYQSIMSLFEYPYDPIVGAALISKVLFLGLIFFCGWVSGLMLQKRIVTDL